MKQTEIIRFGTQIVKYSVDKELINEMLESSKKQTLPYNDKLVANIKNEYGFGFEEQKYFHPKIYPYLKDYVEKFIAPNDTDINFDVRIIDMWVNFQKSGEYNPTHNHPGHLSFVFYLQIPEEIRMEQRDSFADPAGSITFTNQQFPKIYGIKDNLEYRIDNAVLPQITYNSLPNTGDLFIFPSHINHEVQSFSTPNIERVSLAGNSIVTGKYKVRRLV